MTEIFFSVENSYNVNFPEGGGGVFGSVVVAAMVIYLYPKVLTD